MMNCMLSAGRISWFDFIFDQKRFKLGKARIHRPGSHKHLRNKDLVVLEHDAQFFHPRKVYLDNSMSIMIKIFPNTETWLIVTGLGNSPNIKSECLDTICVVFNTKKIL